MVFSNELMVCVQCGAKQLAHPNIESGWIKAIADDEIYHICPACYGASKSAHKCPKCDRWYNWTYKQCPFCKTAKGMV